MDRHYSKPRQKATEGLVPSQTRGSTGSFFRALKTTSKVLAISLPLLLSKPVFSQTKVAVNIPEGKKTEMVKENKDTKAPTIFGQGKYFDSMEFDNKKGVLKIYGARLEDGTIDDIELDMREAARGATEHRGKEYGKTFSFEGEPRGYVNVRIYGKSGDYLGVGAYLIYDEVILFTLTNTSNAKSQLIPLWASDGTKVFTHEGAICVDKKGNLVATTPTTLITAAVSYDKFYTTKYDDMFSQFPLLVRPNLTERDDQYVDLRDPSMLIGQRQAKLQIDLMSGTITVVPDDGLVIGAR